jgi:hypothetical protein
MLELEALPYSASRNNPWCKANNQAQIDTHTRAHAQTLMTTAHTVEWHNRSEASDLIQLHGLLSCTPVCKCVCSPVACAPSCCNISPGRNLRAK